MQYWQNFSQKILQQH